MQKMHRRDLPACSNQYFAPSSSFQPATSGCRLLAASSSSGLNRLKGFNGLTKGVRLFDRSAVRFAAICLLPPAS